MTTDLDSGNTGSGSSGGDSSSKKNILLIMVDQMRFPRFCYGPDGGLLPELKEILGFQEAETELEEDDEGTENSFKQYFPGFWSLRKNAVVLRNHTIAASACTPSRCTIFTGQYGTRTGVTQTDGLFKNADAPNFPWLAEGGIPTLGQWFRAAGYHTHYFGKWHVSNPPDHSLQKYGFDDWEQSWPEPHGSSINNLGFYRDYGFADIACNFFRNLSLGMPYNRALAQQQQSAPQAPSPSGNKPWLAVVSLTNPHDIAAYPALVRGVDPDAPPVGPLSVPTQGTMSATPTDGNFSFDLNPMGFPQDNANLPPGVDENLSNKPSCQFDYAYKMGLALSAKTALGIKNVLDQNNPGNQVNPVNLTLNGNIPFQLAADPDQSALQFLQYYAWLQQVVDGHINTVLSTLDATGQRENTIVVFLPDHGEYGGAHNYMMEKWHTAYQEALHVPVVVQSDLINPDDKMRQIDALTSHIDILPTLLGLAGIDSEEQEKIAALFADTRQAPPLPGANLTPLIYGETDTVIEPNGQPREGVLFITDDEITEPLPGDPAYQEQYDAAYKIFLESVQTLRDGTGPGPHAPHVPKLAPGPVRQPNHVRCARSEQWKLARYWDPNNPQAEEWELYNMETDACELCNLLVTNAPFPTPIPDLPLPYNREEIINTAHAMRELLHKLEAAML